MLLHQIRKRKRLYWHHYWLLSISEGVVRLRENARMFFIVTMVSTIAFMSVGILASLTSFASQYQGNASARACLQKYAGKRVGA